MRAVVTSLCLLLLRQIRQFSVTDQPGRNELPRWLCALGSAENERLMAEQGDSVVSGAIAPAAAKGAARL